MPSRVAAVLLAALLALAGPPANAVASVQLDDMTWTEVRDALAAGSTTILIPIGGTEQNGTHMALGKHNVRAAALAQRIAERLGNTLVAPVLAYVPEPAGHMRYPGTITVPDAAFTGTLAGAARSFRQHGFRDIVFLGDSGDYQPLLTQLAAQLNREWAGSPTRVHHIAAYYEAATTGFRLLLRERGVQDPMAGAHAGIADTSLTLAIDATRVRAPRPAKSSADLGQAGVDLIVDKSVIAIRHAIMTRP